jgi:hypothetical protein
MSLYKFGFPPIEDLAVRLRVMAAVSEDDVKLTLPPGYLRQIAARLDMAGDLQAQVGQLQDDLRIAVDEGIRQSNRCVALLLWTVGLGALGLALAGSLLFRVWL